eukprot:2413314-Rhodomonas_salina.2
MYSAGSHSRKHVIAGLVAGTPSSDAPSPRAKSAARVTCLRAARLVEHRQHTTAHPSSCAGACFRRWRACS